MLREPDRTGRSDRDPVCSAIWSYQVAEPFRMLNRPNPSKLGWTEWLAWTEWTAVRPGFFVGYKGAGISRVLATGVLFALFLFESSLLDFSSCSTSSSTPSPDLSVSVETLAAGHQAVKEVLHSSVRFLGLWHCALFDFSFYSDCPTPTVPAAGHRTDVHRQVSLYSSQLQPRQTEPSFLFSSSSVNCSSCSFLPFLLVCGLAEWVVKNVALLNYWIIPLEFHW